MSLRAIVKKYTIKGLSCEVWKNENHLKHFCCYVAVDELNHPDLFKALLIEPKDGRYAYSNIELLEEIPTNGGVTYYERGSYYGGDGKEYPYVKFGWDYAHSWDMEFTGYGITDKTTEDQVYKDLVAAAEALTQKP